SYIELGDSEKAIDEAKHATEIEKRSVEAWTALGRAQWQQKNLDQAEQSALKARDLDPGNASVSDLLLHVYFDQSNANKFQTELDRTPNPTKATQDLAVRFLLRQGQFARAADWKIRYEREVLNRAILESELQLKRDSTKTDIIPQLVKNLV